MITETTYQLEDLHDGTCDWCGESSHELINTESGEEVCLDCIMEEKFYQETMQGI